MRCSTTRAVLLAIAVGVTGAPQLASAQATEQMPGQEQEQRQARPGQPAARAHAGDELKGNLARAEQCIGKQLKDQQNQNIGEIKDLVLDTQRDQAAFAVVALEGEEDQLRAVPFKAIKQDEQTRDLKVQATKDKIQQTQELQEATMTQQLSQRQTSEQLHRQHNVQPYWEAGQQQAQRPAAASQPGAPGAEAGAQANAQARTQPGAAGPGELVAFSKLQRSAVQNQQGQRLGQLQDIVIDVPQAALAYGIIKAEAQAGEAEGQLMAVPFNALEHRQNQFVIDATEQQLQAVTFDSDNWPDLSDRQVAMRVHRQFNQTPYWETLGYSAPGQSTPSRANGAAQQPQMRQPGQTQQPAQARPGQAQQPGQTRPQTAE